MTDKAKVAQRRAEAEAANLQAQNVQDQKQNTIEFALSTHRVFKTISIGLQGLLAGLTLWQIIASFMLLNNGPTTFLENYYMLATPWSCLYYFLIAIGSVAVLDRCAL